MAYTTIDDGSEYFHTQLYTGNGSSGHSITNDANAGDFQPDWLWIKPRSASDNHVLFDSNRGNNKQLKSNGTDAEDTHSPARLTFETDGFDLDTTDGNYNGNGTTYVAWQWKANGGSTTTVNAGTVDTNSTTACVRQVNTTAGFSIITYTADSDGEQFLEHGLGVAPTWLIVKDRGNTESWQVGHQGNTGTTAFHNFLELDGNGASTANSNRWLNTAPTANLINIGSGNSVGGNGRNYICYAFAEIQGYSKFSSFKGNGNADGTFVYTGFKPAWLMIKETVSGGGWGMWDNKRTPNNAMTIRLLANTNAADDTSNDNSVDFLSNGFKMRTSSGGFNQSSTEIIYMAFAEHPFVSSKGVPTTAR